MTTRRGRCSTRTQYGRNVEHAECRPRDTSYSLFFFPPFDPWQQENVGKLARWIVELSRRIVEHCSVSLYNWTTIITRCPPIVFSRCSDRKWGGQLSQPSRGFINGSMSRQKIKVTCNFWMISNGTSDISLRAGHLFPTTNVYRIANVSCSEWIVWSIRRGEAIWGWGSPMVRLCKGEKKKKKKISGNTSTLGLVDRCYTATIGNNRLNQWYSNINEEIVRSRDFAVACSVNDSRATSSRTN